MDESLDISAELARSFEEYNCEYDDVIVYESQSKQKCTNPVTQMVNDVLLDRAKYNKSYAAASEYAQNLNSVPGAKLKLPTTKNELKREAYSKYNYEHYIYCESCDLLFKKGTVCGNCGKSTKKHKNNYFIYIPLLQQIENMLDKYLDIIIQYSENGQQNSSEMRDIYDSNIFRKIQEKSKNEILLPFTICTDGVKIFNSSKTTLWPVQMTQGYLPPTIRFHRENILLVGLFCGDHKPDMSTIMLPLAREINDLRKGIFTWRNNNLIRFLPTIMFCACDLPARAEIQNCKSSGYHGCPCCKQEGEGIVNPKTNRSYVRFLKSEQPAELRTHEDAVKVGFDIMNEIELKDPQGLKGLSCMIAFKNFDLANGFALDYMHGVTIGVVPALIDIWLGKKKLVYAEDEIYHFKPLTVKQRLELNRRILSLKPVTRIRHKPRSILDRAFFTANEYRSLLWYYLRFALNGLLDKDLIRHFALLSEATYKLSQARITTSEIHKADTMLNEFADRFQYFYGRNSITINIHLLRHYSHSVLSTGPLWCHSMFAFEAYNGEVKRSFNCTVDVVEQIAYNYSIKAAAIETTSSAHQQPRILRLRSRDIEQEIWFKDLHLEKQTYKIGYEMNWRKQVFKSTKSVATKSIDYFVQLVDGSFGAIEMFIQMEKPYVVIRQYDVIKQIHHLKQVKSTQTYRMFSYDEIREKLIYLKYTYSNVSVIEIITLEPNHFEGC